MIGTDTGTTRSTEAALARLLEEGRGEHYVVDAIAGWLVAALGVMAARPVARQARRHAEPGGST